MTHTGDISIRQGLFTLSPLIVFLLIYILASTLAGDFYKIPLTVAFLISSIFAIAFVAKGRIRERIDTFSRGAGSSRMMLMLWIFILAGAFSETAKSIGAVDATVNLALNILPPKMILAAIFLATCIISISIGTSVGTIVALVPIAAGIAQQTGYDVGFLTAIVVGGAFFGDNLSFISDTTIAATNSLDCEMSDKFKVNSHIVMPAAIIIIIVYFIIGQHHDAAITTEKSDFVKIIPYIVVLIMAIAGTNVLAVLTLGVFLCCLIGVVSGEQTVFQSASSMGDGMLSMSELIIITMIAGGLLEIIKQYGGIEFIIQRMRRRISGKRGAELSIAGLIALVNICTANNTVAIITVGDIARQIGKNYSVDKRKIASILDTVSCSVQGLLPYGAQVLMAAGLAGVGPDKIIPNLIYPMAIGIATIIAILVRYPKKYS
ncbi:MAG: Na+/H+ antiporter NhaC family protein [Prevotella sp.]|nr:Na+/H+ antiporter NhaC family protein [Prevotella sp.]